ncbi:MAG: alpha/beta hydrolase family protein [Spirochaetia bacterium]
MNNKNTRLSEPGRPDNRYDTTAGFIHYMFRKKPELAYRPGLSAPDFENWKMRVRQKLEDLLSFPQVPKQPEPKLIRRESREGYRLEEWELYPEPASAVPFLFLIPDTASESNPVPAVICIPGSKQPKEAVCGEEWDSEWVNRFGEHNYMALHMVKNGFAAAAFDNPGTASLAHPAARGPHRSSEQLLWLGRSYEGLSVFQKIKALEWMKNLSYIDETKIAACGHSLGAKPALLLGLIREDITAVVWNDFVSNWRHRDSLTNLDPVALWHYIPGFARWFDYTDIMAALAPKPFLVTEGGREEDHDKIREAYREAGSPEGAEFHFMPNFRNPENRNRDPIPEGVERLEFGKYANYDGDHYFKDAEVIPWLKKVLKE